METGRGTYFEGRWNLVPEPERFRLCRDQETDRQKADRVMKEWQEQQRRLKEKGSVGEGQQDKGRQGDGASSRKADASQGRQAGVEQPAPCTRPDIVGECQATPDQILYQIKRSKETEGTTNR